MNVPLKVGFVGLDTSHVIAFTQILNDPNHPHHIQGAKVVIGYPGGSKDIERSYSRVDKFTAELKDSWGVKIVCSPEAVAETADLVFIESVDARIHREQFDSILPYRKPIFIDKPIALSLADAQYMFNCARQADVPLMSSSSLRYYDVAVAAIGNGLDIVGCDVFGPTSDEPTQPGLFWYGIHSVEMLVTAMGPGCVEVRALRGRDSDTYLLLWQDGRSASFRTRRDVHTDFGIVVHHTGGIRMGDPSKSTTPFYASLLRAVMESLPNGRSAVPAEETLEVIRIIEAANQSLESGVPVRISRHRCAPVSRMDTGLQA